MNEDRKLSTLVFQSRGTTSEVKFLVMLIWQGESQHCWHVFGTFFNQAVDVINRPNTLHTPTAILFSGYCCTVLYCFMHTPKIIARDHMWPLHIWAKG